MDGGKVYEYECKDGALWTVSFGPLGPMAGMSGGRTNGSGEDSPAVFRTGAASRGVGSAGREICLTNGFISGSMLQKIFYAVQIY